MVTEFEIIDNIPIRTNDRISIFGHTGAGKTHFAKNWLLPHYNKYVFWDVKRENDDVKYDVMVNTPKELKNVITDNLKILYQPKSPTESDFNQICEIIFNHRNTTLYVDEAALVSTPTKILYWHNVLITQGRSYGVGIIDVSQRPRVIHNTLISESEHMFVFALTLETDISKIRQQIGDAAEEIRFLPEYHFLYYNVLRNKSYLFKPIKPLNPEKPFEIPELEIYRPSLKEYVQYTSRL